MKQWWEEEINDIVEEGLPDGEYGYWKGSPLEVLSMHFGQKIPAEKVANIIEQGRTLYEKEGWKVFLGLLRYNAPHLIELLGKHSYPQGTVLSNVVRHAFALGYVFAILKEEQEEI